MHKDPAAQQESLRVEVRVAERLLPVPPHREHRSMDTSMSVPRTARLIRLDHQKPGSVPYTSGAL